MYISVHWFSAFFLCSCNFRKRSGLSLCFFSALPIQLITSVFKLGHKLLRILQMWGTNSIVPTNNFWFWQWLVGRLIKSRWEHKEVLPKRNQTQTCKIFYQKRPSEMGGVDMASQSSLCLSIYTFITTLSENWCKAQLVPFKEYFLYYS